MLWCGAVWCGAVRCGAVQCGAVRFGVLSSPLSLSLTFSIFFKFLCAIPRLYNAFTDVESTAKAFVVTLRTMLHFSSLE